MNGTAIEGGGTVGQADPSVWTLQGTGDFDGDGKADILWQTAGGALEVWQMDGTAITGGGTVSQAGEGKLLGIGDASGAGRDDLALGDGAGSPSVWQMAGATVNGTGSPGMVRSAGHTTGRAACTHRA